LKVKITGNVNGGNLQGIVDLDDLEAARLIKLKVAEPADGNESISPDADVVGDHFRNVLKNQSETIGRLNSELDSLKNVNNGLKEENDFLKKQIEILQADLAKVRDQVKPVESQDQVKPGENKSEATSTETEAKTKPQSEPKKTGKK
jgi:FtsZ-binding cell division protein ZapB